MKNVIVFLTIIFVLIGYTVRAEEDTLLGPPPGQYQILNPDEPIQIPFEMFRGDIRMNCEINGRKVRMLLDNGFLWDQILFFGSPAVDSLNLNYDGEAKISGSGEGDPVSSKTASDITIGFNNIRFTGQPAIITPYSSGLSNMWWGCEGQVSACFFKHFVVDINYDDMIITLIKPDQFEYKGNGTELPLKHVFSNSWSIPGKIALSDSISINIDLALDLGSSDAIQLQCNGKHGIVAPAKSLEASLGFGVQGEIRGNIGRIESLAIGNYKIDNVIAGFVSPEYNDDVFFEAMIGMDIFSRFNIIFDYPHHLMFIEPRQNVNDPFEYNMSGMVTRIIGQYREIVQIYPDSPANKAGLEIGDKITTINGQPAIQYDVWDLIPLMSRQGQTITLEIIRNELIIEKSLILKRMI